MKKVLKSFTFWFLLIGLFQIYLHKVGQDSFGIVLIGLNPILSHISDIKVLETLMNSGVQIPCNTVAGSISVYWYIGTIITSLLYGALIDFVRLKRIRVKLSK